MKQALLFLSVFFLSVSAFAQTEPTPTPTVNPPLNERIIGKWMYKGTEEFGVLAAPDSTQKNDFIELTADGNYKMMWSGKEEAGGYKLVEAYKQIYMTNAANKKTKMFTIKSSLNGKLTLDYQTPDLVHTRYEYEKVKQ
ncbi:MAG: hypothetical protein WCI97_01700 [Bacteroidota bacterium]